MERQQAPASLHLSVMPHHLEQADRFLLDLRACVENVRRKGGRAVTRKGKAAIYQGAWVGDWARGLVGMLGVHEYDRPIVSNSPDSRRHTPATNPQWWRRCRTGR